jgi:NAD(P)-dependent dehydrogenase (short-subunit alcohol dehydrogenase family)
MVLRGRLLCAAATAASSPGLCRLGQPEDVANVAMFLASDESCPFAEQLAQPVAVLSPGW